MKKRSLLKDKLELFIKGDKTQKVCIIIFTFLISYMIVLNGAAPVRYNLKLGDRSPYNIVATKDVTNEEKTKQNQINAANSVVPEMKEIPGASVNMINTINDFFYKLEAEKKIILKQFFT